jgi:four helix bundle protein
MNLVTEVYRITQTFPASELYGLANQIKRSAVSIPGNIAEGYGRNSTGDYKGFHQIAAGSLFELQTQIEIALNLNYFSKNIFDDMFEKAKELDRMLLSLIKK